MSKKTFKKETTRKFVAEVNEKGNTGANFIEIAALNEFFVSDLGAPVKFKGEDKFIWNIDGVGRLIELSNGILILEED